MRTQEKFILFLVIISITLQFQGSYNPITTSNTEIPVGKIIFFPAVYAQSVSNPNNSNTSDQSLEQFQSKIYDLEKDYEQLNKKITDMQHNMSQIKKSDLVTKQDLESAFVQFNEDLSNQLSGVVTGADLDNMRDCLIYAAERGSMSGLQGFDDFVEMLKSGCQ